MKNETDKVIISENNEKAKEVDVAQLKSDIADIDKEKDNLKAGAEESNFFYILKGFAIISVIIAHTAVLNSSYIQFDKSLLPLFGTFGLLGVPYFFLASGYFYFNFDKSFGRLILNKLNSIVLPWVFCGTIVYMVTSVLGSKGNTISVFSYFMFIIGNGSLFYFLPVLLFFYLVFYFVKRHIDIIIVPAVIINLASILTLNNIINPYLNPLNFISFFAAGLILKKYNMFDYGKRLEKFIIPVFTGFLLVLAYISYFENTSSGGFAYFKISSVIFEVIGILVVSIAALKVNRSREFLIKLGKFSFSIYLLHMPVAGAVNFIFSRFGIPVVFLKTALVLLIMYIALIFCKFIFDRLNLTVLKRLIGVR